MEEDAYRQSMRQNKISNFGEIKEPHIYLFLFMYSFSDLIMFASLKGLFYVEPHY